MNKTVFVTGGQNGTGRGIAEFFARQGWDVLISGRRIEEVYAAAKSISEKYKVYSNNSIVCYTRG